MYAFYFFFIKISTLFVIWEIFGFSLHFHHYECGVQSFINPHSRIKRCEQIVMFLYDVNVKKKRSLMLSTQFVPVQWPREHVCYVV